MYSGSIVALITPFVDGNVDMEGLEEVIEFQIENGTNGIVPCGTTGESATLTHEEHHTVIRRTVEVVNGRVPVIAGTGSNATAVGNGARVGRFVPEVVEVVEVAV